MVRKFGRDLDVVEDREYAGYIFETPNGLYRTFQHPVVGGMDGFLVSDLDKRRKDEGLDRMRKWFVGEK